MTGMAAPPHVFMVSLDRSLAGEGGTDAVARHTRYAEVLQGPLSVVVVTPPGFQHLKINERLETFPTNARGLIGHARSIFYYYRIIRRAKPIHLLIAQDLAAPVMLLLKWFTKLPLLVNIHGVWWDSWFSKKGWRHRWYLPIMVFVFKNADAVRVVSHHLRRELIKRGLHARRIHVIPTPVNLIRFMRSRPEALEEVQRKIPSPFVLAVGRLEYEKGFDQLLFAWELLQQQKINAHLAIVGEGSKRSALEAWVHDHHLEASVTFMGRIASESLPPFYHAARCVALASRSESFGKVLVEAGAAGKASVATNTHGAAEIIQNGTTGYLIPQGGMKAFAEKLARVISDPVRTEEMGSKARARVMQIYDGEKNSEKLVRLWKRMARAS
ncbi:MAG: glycosyltransferase family 4 protein [Patescibacteria group bacterium]